MSWLKKSKTFKFPNLEVTIFDLSTGEIMHKNSILYPKGIVPEPSSYEPQDSLERAVRDILVRAKPFEMISGVYYCHKCADKVEHYGCDSAGYYKCNFFRCSCGATFSIRTKNRRTKVE